MSSLAARTRVKFQRRLDKGETPESLVALGLHEDAKEHQGCWYFSFSDRSYLRVWWEPRKVAQVLSHHTSQTAAEKILKDISAKCQVCDTSLWCDMQGQVIKSNRFEIGERVVNLCPECQRSMVISYLVGE